MEFNCLHEKCESKCCKNLKSKVLFINYDIDSKKFIHFLHDPNDSGIAIFKDEKELLSALALERKIDLKILPLRGFMGKDGKIYVFKWFLDHDNCPFLLNNSCSIYAFRPIICRSFPCLAPFALQNSNNPVYSKYCPCVFDGLKDEALLANYDFFIKKQNALLDKINDLAAKGFVLKSKTSTVMRLSKINENLKDFF